MTGLNEKLRLLRRRVDETIGIEVSEAESRKVFADFRKALEREQKRRAGKPRLRGVSR